MTGFVHPVVVEFVRKAFLKKSLNILKMINISSVINASTNVS